MSFCLIILAGGNSHRFRSNIGKPYQKIACKSLIEINLIKARKFKEIKKIILVYNKKDLKRVKSLKLKNVKLINPSKFSEHSFINFPILVNNKKKFRDFLFKNNFDSSKYFYRNCNNLKIFKKFKKNCKNLDNFEKQLIFLPIHHKITKEYLEKLTKLINTY